MPSQSALMSSSSTAAWASPDHRPGSGLEASPRPGTGAQTGSPLFADTSVRPNGGTSGPALDGLAGFQLLDGSPAIGNGIQIADNGGADFWGNAPYQGAPDIGLHQRP